MTSEELTVKELEGLDKTSPKNIHSSTDPGDSAEHQSLVNEDSKNITDQETDWVYLEDVPDYMKCTIICCNVFEAPQLLTCCGRSICKQCIEFHIQRTAVLADQKQFCPLCRKEEFKLIKNTALELSIDQLKVQCPYKSNGCAWTGTLQNGRLHLTECDFLPIDCPNKCNCTRFERRRLPDHMANCPLRSVSCSFEKVGCTTEKFLLHGDVAKSHAVDNLHYHLLLIAQLNTRISTECTSVCFMNDDGIVQMKNEAICSQNKTLESLKSVIMSLELSLQETQQKIDLLKREIAREAICLTELKKKGEQTKTTVMSCKMTFDQVQALPPPKSTGISCPPVTFNINHFRKRMITNEMWLSPPFYTHVYGYKMCLSVYPNGSRQSVVGTCVSVNIHFMTGEFDDHLSWPFSGAIFTLTAIHQHIHNCNKSVHLNLRRGLNTRCVRSRHIDGSFGYGYGVPTFLHHNDLKSFLNGDSLKIMIYRIQFLPL